MGFMAGLTTNRGEGGVRSGGAFETTDEASRRVTPYALRARGPGRYARGIGMAGDEPFGALDMMCGSVMALVTVPRGSYGDGQSRPVRHIGIAQRRCVFAARTMATLALHVRDALQGWWHGVPIAIRQDGRKRPPGLGSDVVEPTVDRIGINIVTSRMAL